MKFRKNHFRVAHGASLDLTSWPTLAEPVYKSKTHYQELQAGLIDSLKALQKLLYANNKHALLLIFQGMDTAGKDGAIRSIMSGINPQGCQVTSFQHPSSEELDHDFLWHANSCLPKRGSIGIFNRSYYEEVLIVRVHPELLEAENLPMSYPKNNFPWEQRYRSILDMERHLHVNGTRIIKFFLHLSRDEQRKRLLKRIDEPDRNWKFSDGDITERKAWNKYMKAYEQCLGATSTTWAPWHIIPADDKMNTRLLISRIICSALKDLGMHYPMVGKERRRELEKLRHQL